jgi:two-component sensor histidine kinase
MVLVAALIPQGLFTLFLAWAPPSQPSFTTFGLGVLLFLTALLIAVLGADYLVVQWQRRLQSRVAIGSTDPSVFAQPLPPDAPADIADMDAAVAALAQRKSATEQLLQDITRENEHLLREVHHRVKNNMQIVASLLSLHASAIKEDRGTDAFAAALARINALTSIHREMYATENLREIDLCTFLTGLLANSNRSDARHDRVQLTAETGNAIISPAAAVPLGMLMLEAVGQAIGSPQSCSSNARVVAVALRLLPDGRINMMLRYPAAVPEWLPQLADATLGQTLVGAYLRQLDAKIAASVMEEESSLCVSLPASFALRISG